ncbi:hypothetical protein [Embleya sp. NPDC005575]|uniref:hypothetical protein n=1 Tax=Embleya sp. NPDC005575 TaxID=3156892 RepID=UPI0033A4FA18
MRKGKNERDRERTAARACEAVEKYCGIAAEHNSELRLGSDFRKDIELLAGFNDLHYAALYAVVGRKPEALWIAAANASGSNVFLPMPTPSTLVLGLGSCTFHVVLYLNGHQEQYAQHLHHRLEPWDLLPRRYAGRVNLLPHKEKRGEVWYSGGGRQHHNGLLPRDRDGLRVGDHVEFSLAWDAKRRSSVAVLLTPPGQHDRRLGVTPMQRAFHVSAETAA